MERLKHGGEADLGVIWLLSFGNMTETSQSPRELSQAAMVGQSIWLLNRERNIFNIKLAQPVLAFLDC